MKPTDYTKSNPKSAAAPHLSHTVRNPEDLPEVWTAVAGQMKAAGVLLNGKRQTFVLAANPDRILQFIHDDTKPLGERCARDEHGGVIIEVVKGDVCLLPPKKETEVYASAAVLPSS